MSTQTKKTKGTPDEVDIHVGTRLRSRRSLLGIGQEKLANAIGLTFQQVQKYERGQNRISAGRLFQFSKILDVPVTYFFDSIDGQDNQVLGMSDNDQSDFHYDGEDNMLNNKETVDLLRAYYSIEDKDARKEILRFIKSMSQKI